MKEIYCSALIRKVTRLFFKQQKKYVPLQATIELNHPGFKLYTQIAIIKVNIV